MQGLHCTGTAKRRRQQQQHEVGSVGTAGGAVLAAQPPVVPSASPARAGVSPAGAAFVWGVGCLWGGEAEGWQREENIMGTKSFSESAT